MRPFSNINIPFYLSESSACIFAMFLRCNNMLVDSNSVLFKQVNEQMHQLAIFQKTSFVSSLESAIYISLIVTYYRYCAFQ